MKLSIIKNDRIQSYTLPNEITNSYWITDYDKELDKKNLIQLKFTNGKWKILSSTDIKVIINNSYVMEAELKEYDFFYLKSLFNDKIITIYCYPEYDNTFKQYQILGNSNLSIGSSQNNNIFYNSNYITPDYAFLTCNNGIWNIKVNNNKAVFVNNVAINSKTLSMGDVIFIMGLKIIVTSEFLVINNPNNLLRVDINQLLSKSFVRENVEIPKETLEVLLYENSDYFHRSPRFISGIQESVFEIDPPPEKEKEDEKPFIYTLGPMLTMGLVSVTFALQAINGVMYENRPISSAIPSIVMAVAMLSSTLLWPLLSRKYDKRQKAKRDKKIKQKYTEYINDNNKKIESEISNQKVTLLQNHVSLSDCQNIILGKNGRLWERRINDDDFLLLRLGIGNVNSKIEIKTQKKGFSLDDNNLRDMLDKLETKSKVMENVPVCLPFTEKYISAVVGDIKLTYNFICGLILRMITFHSYNDLKIVIFTNENNENLFKFLKVSPHCFGENNQIRFFASNNDEVQQVSNYIDEIFNKRKSKDSENSSKDLNYKSFTPYYMIIVDDIKDSRNSRIIRRILESDKNYGFSVIFRSPTLSSLPNECNCFMNIFEKESGLFENELVANKQKIFNADFINNINLNSLVANISNIPIEEENHTGTIKETIGFLEMYNVGKVEQLNVQEKWKNNNTSLSLQAPIGIDEVGEIFKLDIHEKYHGPHGLIAGMTGSGKSEFIITYILSLAVQYHPNDVSFVLIDYKGGGLSGAFENKETGVKLPHLAGSITNLDTAELNRALASIQSELKRRQALFNKTRDKLNESTMDIYKYQNLYKQGLIKEPISHLLIISDEFAELKSQRPEFMEQLISTARIGRSLGVHLILATQKPAGVVNDQIWSNSRFRVCLKVQEKSDSMDVIKSADAAELKNVGRFYLQVGYNELYTLGQAAWCGMQYIPQDTFKKKVDTSVNFIDNVGNVIKSINSKKKNNNNSLGEELPNVVSYLNNVALQSNISVRKLWLDRIPGIILVDDLRTKYGYNATYLEINPIIGEYDDPSNQKQDLLTLNLSSFGNTAIYGVAGSGKAMLLNSLIYSTITNHGVDEVNIYIMDFGAETLKSFIKAPHVGDVILINETEKINNLFKQLQMIMDQRKKLFVNYSGDYKTYCKKSGKVLPTILVIINCYEVFQETFDQYFDDILKLTREGQRYGVIFILTTNSANGIRYTLSQNFGQIITLKFNDNSDYFSLIGNTGGIFPSKEKGRGLIKLDSIYEFQTTSLIPDNDNTEFIEKLCEKLANNPTTVFAAKVPVLPEKVTINTFSKNIINLNNVPLGISKETLEPIYSDFSSRVISVITSDYTETLTKFTSGLITELLEINNIQLINIDAADIINENNFISGTFIKNNFDQIFNSLFEHLQSQQKNDANYKKIVCLIEGMNNFINGLSMDNKSKLNELFNLAKTTGSINFILVDSTNEFKKLAYELWFTTYISKNSFIWIGSGISNQYTFEVAKMIRENSNEMNDTFGYIVQNGTPILVKLLEYVENDIIDE